ncbi:MAG: MAPEG family protein [Propionivibrio sp.]|uniref:MAPEG family protein n=1 Tax=Propionivibrio sp. TaxID=2212460 RepID=UPI001A63C67C|nr:MAPEG family protein [Propionivibrio sp.]MBL8413154.1 MAPEG family protein [Propionivibrio sp.]
MNTLPLYAALLALLFVALSIRTLRLRRRLRIGIGDAGNEQMLRAMRVHSNFAEYVPLTLFLIYLAEMQGAHALFIHALGLCLLAGRLSHAYGVSQANENYTFRVAGMSMTFTSLISASAYLLFNYSRTFA